MGALKDIDGILVPGDSVIVVLREGARLQVRA